MEFRKSLNSGMNNTFFSTDNVLKFLREVTNFAKVAINLPPFAKFALSI